MQLTNLQQVSDAMMSIWTKIVEECFQHLVKSMPRRIKAGKEKGQYKQDIKDWRVYIKHNLAY